MIISITPAQFQAYEHQLVQPVEDGDTDRQKQKTNAAYWVAYCYLYNVGGARALDVDGVRVRGSARAQMILEQVVQKQTAGTDDNTGKHRCLLAFIYELDGKLDQRDQLYHQAIPRLEMEVQQGGNDENHQEAAYLLGECLFHGYGVDKDEPRGIHWWKKATELGHAGARTAIEINCFEEPYAAETASWLQKISDQNNNPWAQCQLGRCYESGEGVKKDLVKAVEWYNIAIAHGDDQGDDRPTRWRQDLLNELPPEERSKTMGCAVRNQKIEKARDLIQQSFVGAVPLSLWSHALASLQHQENPPWEAPSPTFLALSYCIMPQLY